MIKSLQKSLGMFMLAAVATTAQAQVNYSIDFSTSQEGWTALDANGDGKTWTAGSSWQDMSEQNRGNCVYTAMSGTATFDDYYVSPSVELEAGKNYKVSVVGRQNYTGFTLALAFGTSATDASSFVEAASWDVITGLTRSGWVYNWDGTTSQDYVIAVSKSGTYNVGLHAVSTEATGYSYNSVALFSYSIAETDEEATITVNPGGQAETAAPDVVTNAAMVKYGNSISLEWNNPTVDANGEALPEDAELKVYIYENGELAAADPNPITGKPGDYSSTDFETSVENATYTIVVEYNGKLSEAVEVAQAGVEASLEPTAITPDQEKVQDLLTQIQLTFDREVYTNENSEAVVTFENRATRQVINGSVYATGNTGVIYANEPIEADSLGNVGYWIVTIPEGIFFDDEAAYMGFQSGKTNVAKELYYTVSKVAPVLEPTAYTPDTLAAQPYLSNVTLTFAEPVYTYEGSDAKAYFENRATRATVDAYVTANDEAMTATFTASDPEAIVAAEDGTPGYWTLVVPEGVLYNTDATESNFTAGQTNKELNVHYVVGQLVADLEPTGYTPDTLIAQPYLSNVTLTFAEPVYTYEGSDAKAYFENRATRATVDAYVTTNDEAMTATFTASDPEAIVADEDGTPGYWTLVVPEGVLFNTTATEAYFGAGSTNKELNIHYVVGQLVADLEPTAVTPDTAAVQEYLSNVTLTFAEPVYTYEGSNAKAYFENRATRATVEAYVTTNDEAMTATFTASDPEAIVAAEDGTPGYWTLVVPEGVLFNTTATESYFGAGSTNKELNIHYVVGQLVETLEPESVVPATTEVQEYLSNITLDFGEEVFTTEESLVDGTITLTNLAEGKEVKASAYVSGNTLVIYPLETIEAAEDGTYSYWTVNVPAGVVYDTNASENNFQAGRTNPALTYNYTVGKEVVTPEVIEADPENGSTVGKLSKIEIKFIYHDYAGNGQTEELAYVKNAAGEVLQSFDYMKPDLGVYYNSMTVTLPSELTEDGTYTIEFPAGFFGFGESGDEPSKPFTLTYTIDHTLGISGVTVDSLEGKTVYTIGGQKINKVNQKGLYIVDGKKVVVK